MSVQSELRALYHAKNVIERKSWQDSHNQVLQDNANELCKPVRDASAKCVKRKEALCALYRWSHCFLTRFLPVLAVTLLTIAVLYILMQTVLSGFLHLNFDPFVERVREYAIEHVDSFPELLMTGNLKRMDAAERIALFNSERFAVDCYAFLAGSLIWMTLAVAIVLGLAKERSKKSVSTLALILDIAMILVMIVMVIIRGGSIIGGIVGVLWMAFSGIRLMWSCGIPIMVVFAVWNTVITVPASIYEDMKKHHHAKIAPKLALIVRIKREIADEKAACEKKCREISKPFEDKMRYDRANETSYNALPSYMRNYDEVVQCIRVLENGLAHNIIDARKHLYQVARDAQYRKALEENRRALEANRRAAEDVARALREPVEVHVYHH